MNFHDNHKESKKVWVIKVVCNRCHYCSSTKCYLEKVAVLFLSMLSSLDLVHNSTICSLALHMSTSFCSRCEWNSLHYHSCFSAMSDINWKDVLRDKSPLFEQYINDRKAKKRLIPSCECLFVISRKVESIVRAAISECCIIDISTESVQNNILSQRDKLMFVSRLVHFLNGGNLEIWDLHSFLSCREIVCLLFVIYRRRMRFMTI